MHTTESIDDLFDRLGNVISSILYKYSEELQYQALSSVGFWHCSSEDYALNHSGEEEFSECMGLDPLVRLEENFEFFKTEIDNLRTHKHEWDERGFCWCGWDGNA